MSWSTKSLQQNRAGFDSGGTYELVGQLGQSLRARSSPAVRRFTAATVPALYRRSELELTTYSHCPAGSTATAAGKKNRSVGGAIPLSPKPQPPAPAPMKARASAAVAAFATATRALLLQGSDVIDR